MKTISILISILFLNGFLSAGESKITTPATGTPTRKAICDEMRKYLRYNGEVERSSGHFLFKIERIVILGEYCAFEAYPVKPDGSSSDQLPDVVYTTFLKKISGRGWEVIADLSRTDVPSGDEMRMIRRTFPKEIPTAIIPDYWQPKLRG